MNPYVSFHCQSCENWSLIENKTWSTREIKEKFLWKRSSGIFTWSSQRSRFNVGNNKNILILMSQGEKLIFAQPPQPLSCWHRYYTNPISLVQWGRCCCKVRIPGAEQLLPYKMSRIIALLTAQGCEPCLSKPGWLIVNSCSSGVWNSPQNLYSGKWFLQHPCSSNFSSMLFLSAISCANEIETLLRLAIDLK